MVSFVEGAILIEKYFAVNLQGVENGLFIFRDRSDSFGAFVSFYHSLCPNINGGVL